MPAGIRRVRTDKMILQGHFEQLKGRIMEGPSLKDNNLESLHPLSELEGMGVLQDSQHKEQVNTKVADRVGPDCPGMRHGFLLRDGRFFFSFTIKTFDLSGTAFTPWKPVIQRKFRCSPT